MKVDISRDTFDPSKRRYRVLMQQGRVQLDADFNEQAAILLHYMQILTRDLIGQHGGSGEAFAIKALIPQEELNFSISPGHYYVDGILCENDENNGIAYSSQDDYPLPADLQDDEKLEDGKNYLVYLDVWERHITAVEDDGIREVALGGIDTATRTMVVWQVKALLVTQEDIDSVVTLIDPDTDTPEKLLETKLEEFGKLNKGKLSAWVRPAEEAVDLCTIPPDSLYRGAENQLYRVEIHEPGSTNGSAATFKWSSNNGSDVFPITTLQGDTAIVEHLGRDLSTSLEPDNWVEVVDDHYVKQGRPGPLLQVDRIDKAENTVTLKSNANANYDEDEAKQKHPLLRRWDSAGDIDVKFWQPGDPKDGWIPLEDGIEVRFEGGEDFQTGDYWLIPARTATGNIQWPQKDSNPPNQGPEAMPPHGITHHYAPLGHIRLDGDGKVVESELKDYRRTFEPLSKRL